MGEVVQLPARRDGVEVDGVAVRPGWRDAPLDPVLGALVLLSGVGLCTAGSLLEPSASANIEFAWWAQLLQCAFWAGACATAWGVLQRRRLALLGALLASVAFCGAALFVPSVTTAGATFAWLVELGCALGFFAVVVRAIVVSGRPAPAPAAAPARRRALA